MTEFQNFLEKTCGYEVRSYSGRGMYGKTCIAIEVGDVLEELSEISYKAGENGIEMPNEVKSDSLGIGYVLYWPSFNYTNEVDENDAGEVEGMVKGMDGYGSY